MGRIDLHVHSCHSSDGEFAPRRLVEMAAGAGVDTLAIADHNRAIGVAEAVRAGEAAGVRVVPAIELDCLFGDHVLHMLGYFIDPADPRYAAVMNDVDDQERRISLRRLDLIESLGIAVDRDAVAALSPDGIVTAECVAEVALADERNRARAALSPYFPGGARSDNPYVNFYWDFCSPGKPAHVPMEFMTVGETVGLVRDTGGVPVLAHPGAVLKGADHAAALDDLAALGVAGIEAFSSYHTPAECLYWLGLASEHGMFITCGSDFHGKIKPAITLGAHGGDAHEERTWKDLSAARHDV